MNVYIVLLIESKLHQLAHVHLVPPQSTEIVLLVITDVLNALELSETVLLVLKTELMLQPVVVHLVTIMLKTKLSVHLVVNLVLNVLMNSLV